MPADEQVTGAHTRCSVAASDCGANARAAVRRASAADSARVRPSTTASPPAFLFPVTMTFHAGAKAVERQPAAVLSHADLRIAVAVHTLSHRKGTSAVVP